MTARRDATPLLGTGGEEVRSVLHCDEDVAAIAVRKLEKRNQLDAASIAAAAAAVLGVLAISTCSGLGLHFCLLPAVALIYDELGGLSGGCFAAAALSLLSLAVSSAVALISLAFTAPLIPRIVHRFSLYRMTCISGSKSTLELVPVGTNYELPPRDCRRVASRLARGIHLEELVIALLTERGCLEHIFDAVKGVVTFALRPSRRLTKGEANALESMLERCQGIRALYLSFAGDGEYVCRALVEGMRHASTLEQLYISGLRWRPFISELGQSLVQSGQLRQVYLSHIDAGSAKVTLLYETLLRECPLLEKIIVDMCFHRPEGASLYER
mmetsp:Transcript_11232/g.45689  ORF Transcript_11232/g.45689 Transcript_11232/m.45689 type:complete len:328 (+) Transcript_11232:77-1060(+)